MKRKDFMGVAAILGIGILVAFFVVLSEEKSSLSVSGKDSDHRAHDHKGHSHEGHTHDGHADGHDGEEDVADSLTGPNGGKLLKQGTFALEVAIYEKGVPPRFRVYPSQDGAAIDPKEVKLSLQVRRENNQVERFQFQPVDDYLLSDREVGEPHAFDVEVAARCRDAEYRWEYVQVEERVELSGEAAKKAGVQVRAAGPAQIRSVLELPGEIALNADRVCHVVPRVPGVVGESHKNLGDPVAEGELIAVIESRELAEAKSRYLVHLKREELARTTFERTESLWRKSVTPEQTMLNDRQKLEESRIEVMAAAQKLMALGLSKSDIEKVAEESDGPMHRYKLVAPFAGVVIKKHMSIGEWFAENADICVIADLSTVWVEIIVYPRDLDAVRIGQKATVKSSANGLEATGVVSYVGPVVGEESRTSRARVVLPNPDGRWKPGLFVTVRIIEDEQAVPVAVRAEAVQTNGDRTVVFVQQGRYFEPRPVVLGRRDEQQVEVVRGVSAGESYASTNSFILKAELGKAAATCGSSAHQGHSH